MIARLFLVSVSIFLINVSYATDLNEGYTTPPLKTSNVNYPIVAPLVLQNTDVTEEFPTAVSSKKKKFDFSEKITSTPQSDIKKKKLENSSTFSPSSQGSNNVFTPVSSEDSHIHQKIYLPLKNPQKPVTGFCVLLSTYEELKNDNSTNLKGDLTLSLEKVEPLNEESDQEFVILPQKRPVKQLYSHP